MSDKTMDMLFSDFEFEDETTEHYINFILDTTASMRFCIPEVVSLIDQIVENISKANFNPAKNKVFYGLTTFSEEVEMTEFTDSSDGKNEPYSESRQQNLLFDDSITREERNDYYTENAETFLKTLRSKKIGGGSDDGYEDTMDDALDDVLKELKNVGSQDHKINRGFILISDSNPWQGYDTNFDRKRYAGIRFGYVLIGDSGDFDATFNLVDGDGHSADSKNDLKCRNIADCLESPETISRIAREIKNNIFVQISIA